MTMTESIHPRAGVVLLAVLVVMVSGVAAASTFTAGAGVTYETPSGLETTVAFDHEVTYSNPFSGSDSVTVANTTITGGGGNVTIGDTGGAYLNLSAIDAEANDITVDGETQSSVTVAGNVTDLDISDVGFGSDAQFVYTADGQGNVTVTGLPADTRFIATDGSSLIDSGQTDSNGEVTIAVGAATNRHVILKETTAPTLDEDAADPQDNAGVSGPSVNLSIPIADEDFAVGDEVTVELYVDGSQTASKTISSNQTVSFDETFSTGGQKEWSVEVSDVSGNTVVSDSDPTVSGNQPFAFKIPAELTIRDVNDPSTLVGGSKVNVTFFGSQTVESRSDDDGKIPFNGLPLNERFEITVDADGYARRTVVLPSLFEQRSAYLLDANATVVRPRFQIDSSDSTFPEDDSRVIIERPVNNSGTQEYATITSAQPGINGFNVALEQDQRYRVTIRAPNGDTRQLGSFVPTATEQVVLDIQDAGFQVDDDVDSVALNASWVDADSGGPAIDVQVQGNDVVASSVNITERANGTVVLDESFEGSATVSTPADQNKQYEVTMTATRELDDGSTRTFEQTRMVSSGRIATGGELPGRWQTLFAMAFMLVVGGLFTRANAGIGAIVIAGIGAIMWTIGWLPAAASG